MRKFTFAILFMALTAALQAQEFHFGLTAGATYGGVQVNSEFEKPSSVIGYNFGVFAELPLSNKFSLRPELKYQTLGYNYDIDDEEELDGLQTKMKYLTLPVLLEYSLVENLKVVLGPYVAMKLGVDGRLIAFEEEESEFGAYEWVSESDHFKALDVGVSAGLHYQIGTRFGLNARYNMGLSNILKGEGFGEKVRNRYFSLGLSCRLW